MSSIEMFIDNAIRLLESMLTSGVANVTDGIEQSFAFYDIDNSHITHSPVEILSRQSVPIIPVC